MCIFPVYRLLYTSATHGWVKLLTDRSFYIVFVRTTLPHMFGYLIKSVWECWNYKQNKNVLFLYIYLSRSVTKTTNETFAVAPRKCIAVVYHLHHWSRVTAANCGDQLDQF